jgi:mono/diheme cytochrome c family protein
MGLAVAGVLGLVLLWQHTAGRRPAAERERLAVLGRRVFARECAACHGPRLEGRVLETGVRVPPLDKPGFRFFFLLLPAAMEDWVRGQIAAGNAVMPPFGAQLDAETLEALALYLRLVNSGALGPG